MLRSQQGSILVERITIFLLMYKNLHQCYAMFMTLSSFDVQSLAEVMRITGLAWEPNSQASF
jgi:hypothetical protein